MSRASCLEPFRERECTHTMPTQCTDTQYTTQCTDTQCTYSRVHIIIMANANSARLPQISVGSDSTSRCGRSQVSDCQEHLRHLQLADGTRWATLLRLFCFVLLFCLGGNVLFCFVCSVRPPCMSQRASPRFKGGAGCTTCHVPHFVVSFVYACFGC